MKKYYFLIFIALFTITKAQTDLVRWDLTSNGNVSSSDKSVTATSISTTDHPIFYDSQGMRVEGWNNSNIEHYRFFGFSVGSSDGSSIKLASLLFEQEKLTPGPENYTIRYYIAPDGNTVDDNSFFYTVGSTILVNNESISSNPIKNIPLNLTISGTQRLIVKFYSSGNSWNGGWRIKANTLRITKAQESAPIAVDDSINTFINQSSQLSILANDTYTNLTSINIIQDPTHGVITVNGTTNVTYVPNADYTGLDSFKYTLTNGKGTSAPANVNLTVSKQVPVPLVRWKGSDSSVNLSPTIYPSVGVASSPISVGNSPVIANEGYNWSATDAGFIFTNWGTGNLLGNNQYIQFQIKADEGYQIILSQFIFQHKIDQGPRKLKIQYSKSNAFAGEQIILDGEKTSSNVWKEEKLNFSTNSTINPGETLYIRIYGYDAENPYWQGHRFFLKHLDDGPSIVGVVRVADETIWQNASSPHWSNGVPNATKNAIIDTHYDTAERTGFESKNLTINSTGSLTINEGNPITVNGQIINNAGSTKFVVADNANLLQKVSAQNIGEITVQKTALLPKMGYNYWSSPVSGQNLYQFSDGYNQANGGTGTGTPWNRFYVYNEANDYFVTSIASEITLNASSTFQQARGYAIRGKDTFAPVITSDTPAGHFQFTGVPQNGDIASYPLKLKGRGFNMIGNPYPSNLDFDEFFAVNQEKINGIAYFWTNNDNSVTTQQGSGYSNYKSNNYALLNRLGGTSATYPGFNNRKPNGLISVGQGFIVKAKEGGKDQPLIFNNSMRHADVAYFYNRTQVKKDRFWLEFKSPTNINNEILIGYLPDATNGFDRDYDTELLAVGNDSFWSILDTRKLGIQARKAPVFDEDAVKIGIKAAVAGNYTITLTDKDGAFKETQTIYIKDKYQNKTFNLSDSPYTFYSNVGQYEDRFEIIYKPIETLGTDNVLKNGIQIYKDVQSFIVKSSDNLDEVSVYDAVGRLVYDSKLSKKEILINKNNFAEGLYIIKARSGNTIITKKVLK